jgi:tripartite-type tricarboxylate transporter receptor subunit TctC
MMRGEAIREGPSMPRRRQLLFAASALPLAPRPGLAQAGPAWPERPVAMVVPFAPGGSPDIAARIVAPRMAQALGQPVVVENRTGAGSTIGTRSVLQARPDGHTVLMGSISFMMAPLTMDPVPFDSAASFRVVSLLATVPYILVVRADAPPRDVAGFHAWVAANRGRLNYGSAGNGTPLHLGGEMYRLAMGADIAHIAYRGTGPAMQDLLAGTVQMVFADLPGATPHIRAGAVRPLAALVERRIPAFPDLPTMAESDPRLAGYDVYTWTMLAAPRATPDLPVQRLHAALSAAVRAPEVAPRFAEMGFDMVLNSPAEGDAYLAREQAKWGGIIRRAGIRAEF